MESSMENKGWRKITPCDFIKMADNIHNFKYEYFRDEFKVHDYGNIKLTYKINIKCKEHENIFSLKPSDHLKGVVGCKACATIKRKNTIMKKYGVEHISQTTEFKEKFRKTMQDRYGCDYAMQSSELSERYRKSLQANYGVDHPSQSKECYSNRNKAMVKKYGVESAMQSDDLKERYRKSLQTNYGVDVPLKSKVIHDRFKTTMKERYGHEYTAEVNWLFKQMKHTNLERYGFEYPLQSPKISENLRTKMEQEGKWIPENLLTETQLYYKQVIKYTNNQPLLTLENYNNRGRAGIEGAYHIDHKISIKYGFVNSIPPYIIGNINNLEMLPWYDNIYKSSNCSINITDLLILMEQ